MDTRDKRRVCFERYVMLGGVIGHWSEGRGLWWGEEQFAPLRGSCGQLTSDINAFCFRQVMNILLGEAAVMSTTPDGGNAVLSTTPPHIRISLLWVLYCQFPHLARWRRTQKFNSFPNSTFSLTFVVPGFTGPFVVRHNQNMDRISIQWYIFLGKSDKGIIGFLQEEKLLHKCGVCLGCHVLRRLVKNAHYKRGGWCALPDM